MRLQTLRLSGVVLVAAVVSGCGMLSPKSDNKNVLGAALPGVMEGGNQSIGERSIPASSDRSISLIFETARCEKLSSGGYVWFRDDFMLDDWLAPLSKVVADEIRNDQLVMEGRDALLAVKRVSGDRTKKMVAHPCSIYALPKNGFDTLVIKSDLGDRLTSFDNR